MRRFGTVRGLQMPVGVRTYLRWLRPQGLPLEDRNIAYFTIDTALQGLMMGGVFSFISVFLVRLGASKLQVSLLTSLPAIVMMVTSIPSGQFVQRQKDLVRFTNVVRVFHRGSILLVALLPFLVYEALIPVVIVLWSLKAISNALLEASWMSVVAELIPPRRRARVNGMRWAILSVVTAASTAGFGYLLDQLPFPLGYQVVFLISFVGGSAGMVFWSKLQIPENTLGGRGENSIEGQGIGKQIRAHWRSLQVPAFVRYELATSVMRLGLNMPTALYSIFWIRELGASDLWIGWLTTTSRLATIVGYFLWGRIVTRRGHFKPLLICTVGMGAYPVLMAWVPDQVWLPFVSLVQGFFMTGVNLAVFDTLLDVCPPDRRPSFMAVNTMLASGAIFVAPLLGSALADWASVRGVFYLAGGVHLIAMVLFWALRVAAEDDLDAKV
jgi:MFS family permease